MKILVLNNEMSYLEEMKNKGFRDDVFVQIKNQYYKVYISDKTRLIQDYDLSISTMGNYVPEPNTLIIDKISNKNITEIIKVCYEEDYFEYLKPCKIDSDKNINYIFLKTKLKVLKDAGLYSNIKISNLIPIYDDKDN